MRSCTLRFNASLISVTQESHSPRAHIPYRERAADISDREGLASGGKVQESRHVLTGRYGAIGQSQPTDFHSVGRTE